MILRTSPLAAAALLLGATFLTGSLFTGVVAIGWADSTSASASASARAAAPCAPATAKTPES